MIHLKKTFKVDTMSTTIGLLVVDVYKDIFKTKIGRIFKTDVTPEYAQLGSTFYWWHFDRNTGTILIVLLLEHLTLDVIGHESFHAIHRLLGFSNTNLTNDTKEVFATKIGYLSAAVLRELYAKPELRRKLFDEPEKGRRKAHKRVPAKKGTAKRNTRSPA